MKRISFVLVLVGILWTNIQIRAQSIEEQVLESLSTLDQSQANTGFLYDRVIPYLPLTAFNGQYHSDSILVGTEYFTMMYGMMDWMHVDTQKFAVSMDSLVNRFDAQKDQDTIALAGMYYHYDVVKEWAIDSQLIYALDTHFYDVPGRSENPYQVDSLWAVTSTTYRSYDLDHVFRWDAGNLFSNVTGAWTSVSIDFGDGLGYRTAIPDQSWVISYPDTGKYHIAVKKTLVGGGTMTAYTNMVVEELPSNPPPPPPGDEFDPFNEVHVITDGFGQGVRIIHWNNTKCDDNKIRKPLIMIDGFDPKNKWKEGLVDKILNEVIDENNDISMGDLLHSDDYDVFYLDFINSTLNMQLNASYVEQAIDYCWVTYRKALFNKAI